MTLRAKARLIGLARPVAVVGSLLLYAVIRASGGSAVASLVFVPTAALLALGLVWPRCRHCGARQVAGLNGWFFVGARCRECFQPLDGVRESEAEVIAALRAQAPPELALVLEQHERDVVELERLRSLAPSSEAAAQLRLQLDATEAGQRAYLRDLREGRLAVGSRAELRTALAEAERAHAAVLAELRTLRSAGDGA